MIPVKIAADIDKLISIYKTDPSYCTPCKRHSTSLKAVGKITFTHSHSHLHDRMVYRNYID
jgi:hypothetical protein